MQCYNSLCFSHPDVLEAISPKWLVRFLEPHSAFLESKGLNLPSSDEDCDSMDLDRLLSILMTPDPEMPRDLVESLYHLHEMGNPEAMDSLLDDAESRGIPIDDESDPTPHDVAIQMWLHDSHLVKHHHAERTVGKPYTFVYFQGSVDRASGLWTPDDRVIQALESDLAEWFEKRKRGPYSMVQFYAREDCMRFVVGHGQPARREGCVCGHRHGTEFYHPEQYDLVIYRPSTGELQVHASTSAETKTYSRLFGRHLFGNDDHFSGARKYTLDPLKRDGQKALVCLDVHGMESVRVTEIQYELGGPHGGSEICRADDVLALMSERHEAIPEEARITEAGFAVAFSDSRTPRTVVLEPSDTAGYERAGDGDRVGRWLAMRGFALFSYLLLTLSTSWFLQMLQDADEVLCAVT